MNSYTVYFTAQLREGFKRSDAIRILGETFALDLVRVKQLLEAAPKAVKRNVAKPQANNIVKALWKGGWHSELYLDDRKVYSTADATAAVATQPPVETHQTELRQDSPASRSERLLRLAAADQSCSLCVPERWQAMQQLNPNACMQAGCTDTDSYLVVIPQIKAAINRQVALHEYAEAVLESAVGWVENGGVVVAAKAQQQLSLTAVLGEIEGMVDGNRVHYLISVYESGDSFYACYLWSAAGSFDQQRPLFQAILASFRFQ